MRLPRDLSGKDLAKALASLGYRIDHQTGSHLRMTTEVGGEHHVTVPLHNPIKIGTLNSILRAVGEHARLEREDVIRRLFG